MQLGLARTADGVLHVISNRGAKPTRSSRPVFRGGEAAGTSTVATGLDGNGGFGLLAMPDGTLRLFAAVRGHPHVHGVCGGPSWRLQTRPGVGQSPAPPP